MDKSKYKETLKSSGFPVRCLQWEYLNGERLIIPHLHVQDIHSLRAPCKEVKAYMELLLFVTRIE